MKINNDEVIIVTKFYHEVDKKKYHFLTVVMNPSEYHNHIVIKSATSEKIYYEANIYDTIDMIHKRVTSVDTYNSLKSIVNDINLNCKDVLNRVMLDKDM